jgi:opacity protein-like surface antigen
MPQIEKRSPLLAAGLALVLISGAYAQDAKPAVDAQSLELKKLQAQDVKNGRIEIIDTYNLKELILENRARFGIKVKQAKSVPNTQSCGVLGARSVVLYGIPGGASSGPAIRIGQAQFDELVGVKNYLMKFEESWENLKDNKDKEITYAFDIQKDNSGNDISFDRLLLTGNKTGLKLNLSRLQQQDVTIFDSKNLKEISEFSQMLDFTANFFTTYNFAECL